MTATKYRSCQRLLVVEIEPVDAAHRWQQEQAAPTVHHTRRLDQWFKPLTASPVMAPFGVAAKARQKFTITERLQIQSGAA
jgi:hypothetical protein